MAAPRGGGDQHVFHHGLIEEQLRDLEGASNAELGDRARQLRRDVLPQEGDGAALRAQIAGRDVEERGLAGAVRADDGEVLAFENVEIDAVGGDHAPEPDLDIFGGEQDIGHQRPPCRVWP
jgi:hypothetical protein